MGWKWIGALRGSPTCTKILSKDCFAQKDVEAELTLFLQKMTADMCRGIMPVKNFTIISSHSETVFSEKVEVNFAGWL